MEKSGTNWMVSEALALGSRLRALEEMLMRNSPPSRNTSGKVSRPEEGSPGSGKADPWSERCGAAKAPDLMRVRDRSPTLVTKTGLVRTITVRLQAISCTVVMSKTSCSIGG